MPFNRVQFRGIVCATTQSAPHFPKTRKDASGSQCPQGHPSFVYQQARSGQATGEESSRAAVAPHLFVKEEDTIAP